MAVVGRERAIRGSGRPAPGSAPRAPTGPFRLVRNPIFSMMLVTAVGLTLLVLDAVAVAGLVALVVALELQVRIVEEPHLAGVHSRRYREYAARAGRFVPRLGRLRPGAGR